MNLFARALVIVAIAAAPAAAQVPAPQYGIDPAAAEPADSEQLPVTTLQELRTLDPYKPSDAALLRDFGDVLVAQVPLLEMRNLDPYKPSDAALIRRIGAGLPLYVAWYPFAAPMPAPPPYVMPVAQRHARAPVSSGLLPYPGTPRPGDCNCEASPSPGPASIATVLRPQSNDGVWIEFQQKRWISAGKTVPHDEALFTRAGSYNELPVYRRASPGSEDLIFLPTSDGTLAPYRLKK